MKITDIKTRVAAIPLNSKLRHNTGVHPGYFLRTILEVFTDEGIIGLGEVGGGDQRGAIEKIKHRVIGLDPFHLEEIKLRALRSIYYLSNSRIYAAIEIACLDIQGKVLNRPMSDLLGGSIRPKVPFIAYLFWRYDRPGGGDDTTPMDIARHTQELSQQYGFKSMKLKAGVMEPKVELQAMRECRKLLGDDFGLRIDPNGVWSRETAVRMAKSLEELDLEYLEDPCWGLTGMQAVRERTSICLATNMYPNKFDDLGPAIKMNTIDIILTDLHYWEGPMGVKKLEAICSTFNLGVAMHSGAEFGIELAAMIHTASTIPAMHYAGDAHYHYLEDDIIEGGKLQYKDGAIDVPKGPGLGVKLDEDKMKHYGKYYEKMGDYYARFHRDDRNPDWRPVIGGM
ncbi:MAG: glucarate dehydratase [Spirochaetes bacterium]|nr:glucarate dehydratase [Spirochaetota bacterium]